MLKRKWRNLLPQLKWRWVCSIPYTWQYDVVSCLTSLAAHVMVYSDGWNSTACALWAYISLGLAFLRLGVLSTFGQSLGPVCMSKGLSF